MLEISEHLMIHIEFLNDPRAKYVGENYYLSPNLSDVCQMSLRSIKLKVKMIMNFLG